MPLGTFFHNTAVSMASPMKIIPRLSVLPCSFTALFSQWLHVLSKLHFREATRGVLAFRLLPQVVRWAVQDPGGFEQLLAEHSDDPGGMACGVPGVPQGDGAGKERDHDVLTSREI